MDIGGWTVDLMRIDNARPVAETAHSLEFGMIRCIDAVREQVRRETGLSLTDAQIEQMLAGGLAPWAILCVRSCGSKAAPTPNGCSRW